MDAEEKWKSMVFCVDSLRKQMEAKAKKINNALEEYQAISRNIDRAELQKQKAWESYQQSLKERGL